MKEATDDVISATTVACARSRGQRGGARAKKKPVPRGAGFLVIREVIVDNPSEPHADPEKEAPAVFRRD